jgi:hypothetical protein
METVKAKNDKQISEQNKLQENIMNGEIMKLSSYI